MKSVAAGPIRDLAVLPEDVLNPTERQALDAARRDEAALVDRINAAANALDALFRSRRLGMGPDAAWSAEVSARERQLEELYATVRAARALRRSLLAKAAARWHKVHRSQRGVEHFDAC